MVREDRGASLFCGPHLAYPTPAASARPPKFDPNKIKVISPRCSSGKISGTGSLAATVIALDLSPKEDGDDVARTTGDLKSWEYRETDRSEHAGPG